MSLGQRCRFKTERLLIESWQPRIATQTGELALARQTVTILTDDVTKALPEAWQGIDTVEQAITWIRDRDQDSAAFTIQMLSNKDIVGFLFLYEEGRQLRLGYLLSKAVWGKGLGSELIKGLVEWCADAGDIASISGGVEVDNAASIRVLEKNGFSISTSEPSPGNMIFLARTFDIGK